MKNIYHHFLLPLSLSFIIFSCNNKENSETIQKTPPLPEELSYKLDMTAENTAVNWIGYKTNEKIAVSGSFREFSTDRENKSFNSIDDLVDGLNFNVCFLGIYYYTLVMKNSNSIRCI